MCAHPDDESFGLGAILAALHDAGAHLRLVCFTAGEDSTLGAGPDLAARRAEELDCAARALGITQVDLLEHPDGDLAAVPRGRLVADVTATGRGTDALLTFDHGGITGHPDHQHATGAAVAAARGLGVPAWGWAIPEHVATTLRTEFAIPFTGRSDVELDLAVTVDRSQQRQAIDCHGSQLTDNPVPARRIELQGSTEVLRLLHDPTAVPGPTSPAVTPRAARGRPDAAAGR